MGNKGLNCETMREEILSNPEVYQTTFMVRSEVCMSDHSSTPVNYVRTFIGEDKIQGLQIMTEKLMLVTMNNVDDMNDLLASVTSLQYYDKGRNVKSFFIPVLPVLARVRIRISGIPLQLASANLHDIKELFSAESKELKDVMLSLENLGNMFTGNLLVDALTNDLKITHEKFSSNAGITFKNFHGSVKFIESFPVREESRGKYEKTASVTVFPWS